MAIVEFLATVHLVTDFTDETGVMRILRLKVPADANFSFTTGQAAFVGHDAVKNNTDPTRLKWGIFSIASSPLDLKDGFVDFCISAHTPEGVSAYVTKNVKVGDSIRVKGAFGHYGIKEGYDHYYFTATGAGIAPYISMIRTLIGTNSPAKLTLFFGFRRSNTFMYREELEKYVKEGKLELVSTISRDDPTWTGKKGYVQERILEHEFPQNEKKCLYACGSPAMIEAVKQAAVKKGILETDIFIEKW